MLFEYDDGGAPLQSSQKKIGRTGGNVDYDASSSTSSLDGVINEITLLDSPDVRDLTATPVPEETLVGRRRTSVVGRNWVYASQPNVRAQESTSPLKSKSKFRALPTARDGGQWGASTAPSSPATMGGKKMRPHAASEPMALPPLLAKGQTRPPVLLRSESEELLEWDLYISSDPGVEDFSARVRFKPWVFLREFLYHAGAPFSFPIVWYRHGIIGIRNRRFTINKGFFTSTLSNLLVWLLCVLWLVERTSLVSVYEILSVLGLALLRNAVISTKFAFYSEFELEQLRTVERLPDSWTESRQLITSWIKPGTLVLRREMVKAARRLGIHPGLDYVSFWGPGIPLSKLLANAGEKPSQCTYPATTVKPGRISAWSLLIQIANDSSLSGISDGWVPTVFAVGILIAWEPWIHRAIMAPQVFGQMSGVDWILLSLATWLTFLNALTNMAYIATAIDHYRRRYASLDALCQIISASGYRPHRHNSGSGSGKLHESHHVPPSPKTVRKTESEFPVFVPNYTLPSVPEDPEPTLRLDMTHPNTVGAWIRMRDILEQMGQVYHRRIEVFLAFLLLYTLALLLVILTTLVIFKLELDSIDIVVFSMFLNSITVFIVALSILAIHGGRLSQLTKKQAKHLNIHLDAIYSKIGETSKGLYVDKNLCNDSKKACVLNIARQELTARLLSGGIALLATLPPYRLLGFATGGAFVKALVLAGVGVAILGVREVI